MADESKSAAAGHRERLRSRFLAGEEAAMSEPALLELLLTFAIPRRDVRRLAEALIERFGDLPSVLAADAGELETVKGVKGATVVLLKLAGQLRSGSRTVDAREPQSAPTELPKPSPKVPSNDTPTAAPATAQADPVPDPDADPDRDHDPGAPALIAEASDSGGPAASSAPPKLQVSNGYSLDIVQTARLLSHIAAHPEVRRFPRKDLMEGTGLSYGQLESLTSVGVALGLLMPVTGRLTPLGRLIVKHDLFLDAPASLEFCHYLAAGNPRNLVWHLIFNELLAEEKPTDQAGWSAWVRQRLAGRYSDRSLVKHVAHEVRFLLDAYRQKNFARLDLLAETPEETFVLRRHTALQPLALAAILYHLGGRGEARLVPFADLHDAPGSPGRLFGLDPGSLRQMVEALHGKGWLRFEVRADLDQVRLLEGYEPLEFLAAAYEQRPPVPTADPAPVPERLLL